jgi:hypothetical protein
MNPWKLTSFVLAIALFLVVGLRLVDNASAQQAQPLAQPHMRSALDHLRAARSDLRSATPDKGGHRAKAIQLTDAAIEQVQRGMKFDRRH